jgi:uncharacterized protein (TIGR03435 family)
MARLGLLFLVMAATGLSLIAQQSSPPAFEVASVKPNPDPQFLRFSILPGGQLITTGYRLNDIIRHAFDTNAERMIGIPDWATREAFDITAKAAQSANGGARQTMAMLQSLLRSRFKLQAHLESREMPVYVMRVARPGKVGPQLRPSEIDCSGFVPGRSETTERNAGPQCAITASATKAVGTTRLRFRGRSMSRLAADLQALARRPVIDETRLSGLFDADIEFAFPAADGSIPPDGITLFTAVEEQLGLRLESSREPVEILVVASLERPTPD